MTYELDDDDGRELAEDHERGQPTHAAAYEVEQGRSAVGSWAAKSGCSAAIRLAWC